jgi:biopolymer transport protein ExbD
VAEVNAAERTSKAAAKTLGLRRPRRRAGIRIDMTPMVDVAFLLLIFFMVTTVFRQPLAMEVNMPEPGAKVEVPQSNVLTVYIDADDRMYYKVGTGPLTPVGWDALIPLFREQAQANPDLIILVKINGDARYERMVDMMDTLDEAHMERFSLVRMTAQDSADLEGVR